MGRDEILGLLDRRDGAWNAHDARGVAATHAADGVVISPTGGVLEGRSEIERVYRVWFTAFPDIVTRREDVVIDGNQVAVLSRFTGTHAGEFFGLAPSGRRVEVDVALLITVSDGLIAKERRVYDFTGLLVQVGVLKAKPVG